MKRLQGKVALVTGASRGIGRATAIRLAKEGALVIVNFSANKAAALETLELMGEDRNGAFGLGFDVSDEQAVNNAASKVKEEAGPIDILVNNAGIAIDGLLLRVRTDDFDAQVSVNLRGTLNCSKAFARHMIKNKSGRIINISSVVGEMGNSGQCVYSACKAGIIGMTKSLARELARRNILVNAITPGFIATDMTKKVMDQGQDEILQQIPLRRVGLPEDIAACAAFLASDDASYITGQVLSVNGGLYM